MPTWRRAASAGLPSVTSTPAPRTRSSTEWNAFSSSTCQPMKAALAGGAGLDEDAGVAVHPEREAASLAAALRDLEAEHACGERLPPREVAHLEADVPELCDEAHKK